MGILRGRFQSGFARINESFLILAQILSASFFKRENVAFLGKIGFFILSDVWFEDRLPVEGKGLAHSWTRFEFAHCLV